MKKKSFIVFLLSSFFIFLLSAESYSKQQLIPADSWIYDALYSLSAEQKMVVNADIAPCSVKELQLYFDRIDYEKLSEPSKALFDKVQNFFEEKKFAFDLKGVSFGFNTILYPELLYKSNPDIDWTYGSFNTCTYDVDTYHTDDDGKLVKDSTETVTSGYYDVSSWGGNKLTQPLIQIPLYINFADYAYIQTTPFITNSAVTMIDNKTWGNIPLNFNAMEFMQPTDAYFSTGYIFDNGIGVDLQIAKEGLQIGRSLTGRVLYNNTFQTDCYVNAQLYSPTFKIDLNVIEADHSKYLYLHNIELQPLSWFRIGATEGVLINAPFELRFLNPFMIMHSYHSWTEYRTDKEYDIYRECHESAYLGLTFDIIPVKNLRLYGIYSQIEIQIPPELKSEYGRQLPTSLALQLGAEYNLPFQNRGWFNFKGEGLYSSPYMYYKTGEDWSLMRKRFNVYNSRFNPLCSWIGSPFGPDSAGFELKASYKDNKDWSVDFSYLFMAQGENSFNLFGKKVLIDDEEYWIYYPSTKINGEYVEDSSLARSFALLGNIEYKNQLTLDGSYKLNDHFKFDGQLVYSFIWNNNHIPGNFQQGIQASLAMEYRLF